MSNKQCDWCKKEKVELQYVCERCGNRASAENKDDSFNAAIAKVRKSLAELQKTIDEWEEKFGEGTYS